MAIKNKHLNNHARAGLKIGCNEEFKQKLRKDAEDSKERQIVLNDAQLKKNVLEKLMLGITPEDACREVGINSVTFRYWIMRDADFVFAYNQCRLGENLMLGMKARKALSDILDDNERDGFGKPITSASTKLATSKFILESIDGDFRNNSQKILVKSATNPDDAYEIIEEMTDKPMFHGGETDENQVRIVVNDYDIEERQLKDRDDE